MTRPTYRKLASARLGNDFRKAVEVVEVELPKPAADEVNVKNIYAGVNASDVTASAGIYQPGVAAPIDMGLEAIAQVLEAGRDVTDFKAGDTVLTSSVGGGYREYYTRKARHLYPVPSATPEMLSLMPSGVTAEVGLHEVGEMKSDDIVMVTAAAGGTGQFAVQLAKLNGNHVIGTCGSDEKVALLRDFGCDRVINYRSENVRDVLRGEYRDGIDLIYESVGGKLFDTCVANLAQHGRLLVIGFVSQYTSGRVEKVSAPRVYGHLLSKSASLRGMFLPHYWQRVPQHLARLVELLESGQIVATVDSTEFNGVESVVDTVEYLHTGQSMGKVVVKL